MSNFKPLMQRTKDELLELCEGFGLHVEPEMNTKKALVNLLEENGITNSTLKVMETEEQRPESVEEELDTVESDKCVVCMDRTNMSYAFKKWVFFQDKKYVVMPKEDAHELITTVPGFHIATVDEIKRNFRV